MGLRQEEEIEVKNIRPREMKMERAVIDCISRVEKSVANVNPSDDDLKWNIVDNFANPTKEEINEQLNRIPAIQAYFNNMKIYAQLLLDIAEHELNIAQVNAREEFRRLHQERLNTYQNEIFSRAGDAMRSTIQDKALLTVREMIKSLKPKDPTDKDIEAFVKSRTQEQERNVIIHRNRFNKLKEFCRILENKFIATRALRYSIEEDNKINKTVSKNAI